MKGFGTKTRFDQKQKITRKEPISAVLEKHYIELGGRWLKNVEPAQGEGKAVKKK